MKIGIIARGLTKGGVTRYIENILRVLNNDKNLENSFLVFTDDESFKDKYSNLEIIYIKKSNKIFWDYLKMLPYLYKQKLDVVLYPKNIIPFTHILIPFRKVNVIHDLAYFDKKLNEYKFFDTLYMKTFMKLSCLIADKIIAVSNSTKKDLENILKINSSKIKVIYEGVEDIFKKETNGQILEKTLSKFNIKIPFMFYCGSLSPRKNILRVLQAFNDIKDKIPHNIYLAGGQSWKDEDVLNYIDKNLSDRVFKIGYISDVELIHLYSSADLYLYPSLYEGFGLPILEAQACGCPILTSNKTSCPEIAGDGAIIVTGEDIHEIQNSTLNILTNLNNREELIKKGYENVRKFNFDKNIKEMLDYLK